MSWAGFAALPLPAKPSTPLSISCVLSANVNCVSPRRAVVRMKCGDGCKLLIRHRDQHPASGSTQQTPAALSLLLPNFSLQPYFKSELQKCPQEELQY